MDLDDVSAVVTGGGSGLGEATARMLVAAGARVVIADRDAEGGERVQTELGPSAYFVEGDVADRTVVEEAVSAAEEVGPLRIAVSCAGGGVGMRTVDRDGTPHDAHRFQKILDINLLGSFHVLSLAAAAMSRTPALAHGERGVVVNTASCAAFDGQVGQLAYSAAKAALVGMTLPAARDLGPIGVRVVTIAPGTMGTQGFAKMPPALAERLVSQVVFPKQAAEPSWYADLVEHIVRNPYLNGEVIRLDGALRMTPK